MLGNYKFQSSVWQHIIQHKSFENNWIKYEMKFTELNTKSQYFPL